MSGMASGLDTESMIQQLMKVERMKVDKVKQDKQRLEWKRDDYREITNLLRGFKDDFFDILKPASNMRSAATFHKYTTSYSVSDVVTATGSAGVSDLTHDITVTKLAKAATGTSTGEVLADPNQSLSLKDTMADLQTRGVITDKNFTLTINGKSIAITETDTLSTLISKVNSSEANVTLSYSAFLDKFTITSKNTGTGTITLGGGSADFFNNVKLTSITDGEDAEFTLDGKASTNANNTFNIDGVTYSLLKAGATTVTLGQDTDTIYKSIKDFVDKYNSVLDKLNSEVSEKYYRDYAPLTDEQKDAMNEDDIKRWEEKAKSGSLRNDSILNNIINKMRLAVSNEVDGVSGTLASIGIKTGDYRDKGKLIIDETKLKEAIKNSPDKVVDLFTKESDKAYSPDMNFTDRTERDKENGIVNRLYDIIQDNIRTTRDSNGKKGYLLEKAGITGDITEFNNIIGNEIEDKDDLINKLLDKLYAKEDSYYKKFSAMETALNKMNSQSSWMAQQFGGGQ